jgi:hypothetical protein
MKSRRVILLALFVLLVAGLYVWTGDNSARRWMTTYAKPTATQAYVWTLDKSESWYATFIKPTANKAYVWTMDKTRSWFTALAKPTPPAEE